MSDRDMVTLSQSLAQPSLLIVNSWARIIILPRFGQYIALLALNFSDLVRVPEKLSDRTSVTLKGHCHDLFYFLSILNDHLIYSHQNFELLRFVGYSLKCLYKLKGNQFGLTKGYK